MTLPIMTPHLPEAKYHFDNEPGVSSIDSKLRQLREPHLFRLGNPCSCKSMPSFDSNLFDPKAVVGRLSKVLNLPLGSIPGENTLVSPPNVPTPQSCKQLGISMEVPSIKQNGEIKDPETAKSPPPRVHPAFQATTTNRNINPRRGIDTLGRAASLFEQLSNPKTAAKLLFAPGLSCRLSDSSKVVEKRPGSPTSSANNGRKKRIRRMCPHNKQKYLCKVQVCCADVCF
jgi:hypothetical protein